MKSVLFWKIIGAGLGGLWIFMTGGALRLFWERGGADFMKKKIFAGVLAAGLLSCMAPAMAAPLPAGAQDALNNNAGVQLNQTLDYIERARVEQQIEEDRARARAQVEGTAAPEQVQQGEVLTFTLNKLETDASSVLTDAELDEIASAYVGKEIAVSDLYAIVGKINELYTAKGFLTCRAFLQPQTIKDGTVKITLIEGRTGNESVLNNKTTKAKYITNRLHLREGEVANINELNKDLLIFNATNDTQLRLVMQQGEKPGTTDYVIEAYEPKKQNWTVFTDNAGSYSTGAWRGGLFYTDRSLTKVRDGLTVGFIGSEGTKAASLQYSRSVGRSGAKLNFSYSTNGVRQVRNNKESEVRGHAQAFNLAYVQPWFINAKTRTEASLEYSHQTSASDFLAHTGGGARVNIADDTVDDVILGFAMTNYGKTHVLYQKHSYVRGHSKSSPTAFADSSKTYGYYKSTGLYQKAFKHGQLISSRFEAQWSGSDGVVSARQFYLGGMNSVRGYKENYLGGDSGFFWNAEYTVPLSKDRKTNGFVFWDCGRVYGESAESNGAERVISSMGLGVKSTALKNTYATLLIGFPMHRDFATKAERVSAARVNFMVSYQF